MEVAAAFVLDAVEDGEGGWLGRVRLDDDVLFVDGAADTEQSALASARAALVTRLRDMLAR